MNLKPAKRKHRATRPVSAFGTSSVDIECPWCGTEVTAYLWSLAGCGKKCPTCADVIHYTCSSQNRKRVLVTRKEAADMCLGDGTRECYQAWCDKNEVTNPIKADEQVRFFEAEDVSNFVEIGPC